jgi:hypothetical protein
VADQGNEFTLADLKMNALEGEVMATATQRKVLDNILDRNKRCHSIKEKNGRTTRR